MSVISRCVRITDGIQFQRCIQYAYLQTPTEVREHLSLANKDMKANLLLSNQVTKSYKYLGFTKLAELAYDHQLKSQDNDANYVPREQYNKLLKVK